MSPFLIDGSKNDLYYSANIENVLNEAALMNGKQITAKLMENHGTNNYYFGAAALCNGYSTVGTSAGEWYLPSIGELQAFASNATTISSNMKNYGKLDGY